MDYFLIQFGDPEANPQQVVSEKELARIRQSAEEFDGFDGTRVIKQLSADEKRKYLQGLNEIIYGLSKKKI